MTYDEALETSKTEPVVVLFTSPTCGPCKQMKPLLASLAERLQFRYAELSIVTDSAAAYAAGVRVVPTFLTLKGGLIHGMFAGARSEQAVRAILDEEGVTQGQLDLIAENTILVDDNGYVAGFGRKEPQ